MGSMQWQSSSSATCVIQLELTDARRHDDTKQCQYTGGVDTIKRIVDLKKKKKQASTTTLAMFRMISTAMNLYSTYIVLGCRSMIFHHSLGQSSPCWLEPAPDQTAWIHRRIAGRQCPPAALLWIAALHYTRPATWPASVRTPAERAEGRPINHLGLTMHAVMRSDTLVSERPCICLFNLLLLCFCGAGLWP